ncbi:EUKARYOTIC TRANSLATION INITIATION FACTOR [Salix viminalis]|uniref:EUKARYOTIC TRANSLATION INITIATION FACTOR n=1 Tax=Salix viminalis TaxID=40686 RepID=A0A9Q0PA77_SALVM|nr:EUKARYOTIC TRANSLATION INITIATION FACTOR [Salix viminalis]
MASRQILSTWLTLQKALARPASYTTKYFGCELGAQSKFDEKTGTSLVNGSHETVKLAGLLENFIKKYVQCYGCGNPETEIIITKNPDAPAKIAACGFVSDVDMRDKLTSFILKNPPESKKGSREKKALRRAEKERLKEGEAADEELKKLKKEAHSQVDEKEDVDDNDDGDVQWQTDTSLGRLLAKRIQEQLSAATADMVMLSTDETEKKAKASSQENGSPKGGASPAREEKPKPANGSSSTRETLVIEIKENLKKGVPASQLKSTLSSLTGTAQEKIDALFEALFEGVAKGFAKEVDKKKNYLASAVAEDEKSQLLLLRAIESFCSRPSSSALKEVALVLKALYDADVLEEECIVHWYHEGLASGNEDSQIWNNAEPFIKWLQSAESESEEE